MLNEGPWTPPPNSISTTLRYSEPKDFKLKWRINKDSKISKNIEFENRGIFRKGDWQEHWNLIKSF